MNAILSLIQRPSDMAQVEESKSSEGIFTLEQKLAMKWYDDSNANGLEDVLGYQFKNIELLHQAIHGESFLPEMGDL